MANVDVLFSGPPGRADPECVLGHLLKILFKNDDFMNAVRIFQTPVLLNTAGFVSKLNICSSFCIAGEQLCDDQPRVPP